MLLLTIHNYPPHRTKPCNLSLMFFMHCAQTRSPCVHIHATCWNAINHAFITDTATGLVTWTLGVSTGQHLHIQSRTRIHALNICSDATHTDNSSVGAVCCFVCDKYLAVNVQINLTCEAQMPHILFRCLTLQHILSVKSLTHDHLSVQKIQMQHSQTIWQQFLCNVMYESSACQFTEIGCRRMDAYGTLLLHST